MKKIAFLGFRGRKIRPLQSIIRLEARGNYTILYLADKANPILLAKTLGWFEEHLPEDTFIRTHQTHLVNIQYINGITDCGTLKKVLLNNGEMIDISRRKCKQTYRFLALSQSVV